MLWSSVTLVGKLRGCKRARDLRASIDALQKRSTFNVNNIVHVYDITVFCYSFFLAMSFMFCKSSRFPLIRSHWQLDYLMSTEFSSFPVRFIARYKKTYQISDEDFTS